MAARGASCAAGAARTLRSPTAWSEPAPDPLVDCRFGDFKRTLQHRDVPSFEEYYAVLPARGWLLSASAEPPKGMAPPFSGQAGRRSGERLGAPRPRDLADAQASGVGLGVLRSPAAFACCVRLLRSPAALLKPPYPGPGALLVGEGILHHLGEVGVSHQLRQLPDVPRVGLQEPCPERAPQVVGLYILLLYAALPHPGVEPSPQGVLANPSALLVEEEVWERPLCGWEELVADLQ